MDICGAVSLLIFSVCAFKCRQLTAFTTQQMQKAFGIHTMEVNTYSDNGDNVTKAEGVADGLLADTFNQLPCLQASLSELREDKSFTGWGYSRVHLCY